MSIAPVLIEIKILIEIKNIFTEEISLFSGVDFNVEPEQG
jgi:hypothetical protein